MPAAIHNFFIEQGSNFSIIFEYLDTNNIPQDLTNYCVRLRLKPDDSLYLPISYGSEAGATTDLYTLSKSANGTIIWALPSTQTQKFKFTSAVYDLDITNISNGDLLRICTGTIQIVKNNFSDCPEIDTNGECLRCAEITTDQSQININPGATPSPGSVTPTPTPTNQGGGGEEIILEDMCDYICKDIDLFAKLYNYSENIVYTNNISSGNITAVSGQTLFTLPQPYAIGSLNLYKNNNIISYGSDYIANNGSTFTLLSPASSGDIITYLNNGLYISDNSSTTGTMFISDTGTITNVEVSIVNLKHPNPQDLSMILVPPTGTGILLSAFSKINNYSYTSGLSYTFSNKASEDKYLYNRSVTDNYVNIYNKTGIFPNTPLVSSLSQLQSISPSGNWSLIINDNDPGGSGYITDWNLVITYLPPSYIE
jgi:subtilisin-like proprotein convertase family protein